MTKAGRAAAAVVLALWLVPGVSVAASVVANGFRVSFSPPRGWRPVSPPPAGVLAVYKASADENFPHVAVTSAEAGDGRSTLSRVRQSLPKLFGELGITDPKPLLSPKLVAPRGVERVDVAYSGVVSGLALDWFQTIVPGARASVVFTFALPRGSFQRWRPALEAFLGSLRVAG